VLGHCIGRPRPSNTYPVPPIANTSEKSSSQSTTSLSYLACSYMVLRSGCSRQAGPLSARAILNPKMIHQSPSALVPISTLVRRTCIAEVTCRYRGRAQDVNRLESTCRGTSLFLTMVILVQALIGRNWIWRWRGAILAELVREITLIELSLSIQQLSMMIDAIVTMIPSLYSTPSARGPVPLHRLPASHPTQPPYVPPRTYRFQELIPIQSARVVDLVIGYRGWTGSDGERWQEVSLLVTMRSRFQRRDRRGETRRIKYKSHRERVPRRSRMDECI